MDNQSLFGEFAEACKRAGEFAEMIGFLLLTQSRLLLR
jgi:hypothetical protein